MKMKYNSPELEITELCDVVRTSSQVETSIIGIKIDSSDPNTESAEYDNYNVGT